jgi:hypothetical protein
VLALVRFRGESAARRDRSDEGPPLRAQFADPVAQFALALVQIGDLLGLPRVSVTATAAGGRSIAARNTSRMSTA